MAGDAVTALRLPAERNERLRLALVAIGVITVVSGLGQLVVPGFVLDVLDASSTPTSRHLFAIVGMFMAVVGGLVVHALSRPGDHAIVVLWGGLQKLGAAAAVAVGVARGIFSPLALLVAGFDLASAALAAWYYRCVAR